MNSGETNSTSHTRDELIAASEHLLYEVKMFDAVTDRLESSPIDDWLLHNACVEAFVIHFRVLYYFLYDKQRYPDDVLAEHFLEKSGIKWPERRPPVEPILAKGVEKANKRLAHLSYKRDNYDPRWKWTEMHCYIKLAFDAFLEAVSYEYLSSGWDSYQSRQCKR
jgi:hypothetical protein